MEKKNHFYSLLIVSFIFLFIPNYNVIDLMPDFISWFILAKLFENAADSAPYFEEARSGFTKLAYLNLAKILGFVIIIIVKSRDVSDNNIFALVSFCFAAVEILFLIPTIKNIFLALFHLGERTDAVALISSQNPSPRFILCRIFSAEFIKEATYIFLIAKTLIYAIPDLCLLTRITDRGNVLNVSRAFPFVLLTLHTIGLFLGILWLIKIIKYSNAVRKEGKFHIALELMHSEDKFGKYESRKKLRSIKSLLLLISISSLFTFEIAFSDWSDINILPHFIYLFLMLIAAFMTLKHTKALIPCYIVGGLAVFESIIVYSLKIAFLTSFSYEDISKYPMAKNLYQMVEALSLVELITTVAFLLLFMLIMNSFVMDNTGLSPDSDRYSIGEMKFHSSLKIKNLIIFIFGSVAAVAKFVNVILNGNAKLIFTDESDVTAGAFFAAAIPWFNIVVTVTALLYVFFTIYFMSGLKDEVKMKYSDYSEESANTQN